MKLVTFEQNGTERIGAVRGEGIVELTAVFPTMLTLIDNGTEGLSAAQAYLQSHSPTYQLDDVHLLAPIPNPRRNIMCLGHNYAEHAEESLIATGQTVELPEFPIIFTKATTAVNGPYDPFPFNAAISDKIDYEVELGVIIGKPGINIPPAEAISYIFGYTIINDISARDLQWQHKQFFKGKSLDGSCPMGPWIITADELDPTNLHITSRVNGITKQASNTRHMIFDIPTTIDHLSRGMTLLPGDIIATGTPSGVGFARTPPEFLQPGNILESEIENIGIMRTPIGT
ncbi:MAG: fumarylacetoacetate hydrolase family protein [Anaerolineae bacterium]|nr:fumarylacetoacetate hydrolase family protein [Anaerolineae bacterium]